MKKYFAMVVLAALGLTSSAKAADIIKCRNAKHVLRGKVATISEVGTKVIFYFRDSTNSSVLTSIAKDYGAPPDFGVYDVVAMIEKSLCKMGVGGDPLAISCRLQPRDSMTLTFGGYLGRLLSKVITANEEPLSFELKQDSFEYKGKVYRHHTFSIPSPDPKSSELTYKLRQWPVPVYHPQYHDIYVFYTPSTEELGGCRLQN
jgi:hypothetical protein